MKHRFTVFTAIAFGLTGGVLLKLLKMYGIIIVFHNSVFRIDAAILGVILGAVIGIILAVIADYKDRLLMAEQGNTEPEIIDIKGE
jgi:H+/Cl- antiporter ClcA